MALDFPVGTDFPANGDQIPDGEIYEGFYWDAATGAWKRVCERDKIGDCLDDDADETVCDKLNEIERDIIELEEEIDAIATSRDRGTWEWAFSVNSYLDLLPAGQFYMVQESDLAVVTDYKDCGRIIFHEDDLENDNHVFNTDLIDKVLMLFDRPDDDFIESVITNVEETTGATGKVYVFHVDRRQSEGSPTNAPDADGKYKARLNIFDQPSGGNAGEYVLKIGDTMTGNLKIDISEGGPTDGGASGKEAALTLKGDRTGTTNSVATIMWDNAASSYPGYLTYRSGTSSEQFFKFNQDVQFNDKILSEINTISIKNKIQKDGSDRITFQSGSGDSGKGTILAHRPGNLQRGFTIKGKVAGSSNTAGDVFYHYANSGAGGDSVDYTGICTSSNHIMNRSQADGRYVQTGTTGIKITKSNGNYYIQG